MRKYPIQLDLKAKIITTSFILLVAYLAFQSIELYKDTDYLLLIAFLVFCTLIAWGYHPVSYFIQEDFLVVERPFKNAKYQFNDIKSLTLTSKREMGLGFRGFASGGLFGYFGYVNFLPIGTCSVYAGNYSNPAIIEMGNGLKVVISSSSELYDYIRNRIKTVNSSS